MKLKNILFIVIVVAAWIAIGSSFAGPGGSHPDSKNNGLGSPRFPNHYAGPSHPQHP